MWEEEKGLISKENIKLAKMKCTYEIVDRLRRDASYLLNGKVIEVSNELVLENDVLAINNRNAMNSLVAIQTTETEPTKTACYAILDKFESFKSITTYYYTEVLPRDNSNDKSWKNF